MPTIKQGVLALARMTMPATEVGAAAGAPTTVRAARPLSVMCRILPLRK